MEKIIFCLLLFFGTKTINAQVKELFKSDWTHAIYDVKKINDSTIICVGENGVFYDADIFTLKKNEFQVGNKISWLNIVAFSKDTAFVIGDNNSIGYCVFNGGGKISSRKSERAHYSGIRLRDKIIAVGGNVGVANGLKKIPNGFVTEISENNRKMLAKKRFRFFFHVDQLPNQEIWCYGYGISNTKIYKLKDGKLQKIKKIKRLIHRAYTTKNVILLCGTNSFRRQNALIIYNEKEFEFLGQDVIWDVAICGNYIIGAGSKGRIYKIDKNTLIPEIIKTDYQENFYRIAVMNDHQCILGGQNGLVVLVDL
jgi:hypothetical protein